MNSAHRMLARSTITACLAAAAALAGSAAHAVVYTSEAAFVTAEGSASITLPAPSAGDFTADGFGFAATPPSSLVIDTPVYGIAIPPADNLLLNGTESFGVTAPAPIYAFGFGIYRPSNAAPIPLDPRGPVSCNFPCGSDPFTVDIYSGASLVDSFSFTPVPDSIEFHGYAGSVAFDRVQIVEGGSFPSNIGDEYFADFRYGRTPQVPEPGTLLLLGAALAGLGLRRTRA